MTRRLRVTGRALRDLGLDESLRRLDARLLVEHHELIRHFVEMRERSPVGQEPTRGIRRPPVWNLHSRTWRAVTWHDEEEDVVWLCGAGRHQSGAHDVYDVLVERGRRGLLLPGTDDYLALEPDAESFLQALADEAPKLMARAAAEPNQEHRAVLGARLDVGVLVEVMFVEEPDLCDVYVAVQMPPRPGPSLPPEIITVCVAALLPEADHDLVEWDVPEFPRPEGRRRNERVVRWRRNG